MVIRDHICLGIQIFRMAWIGTYKCCGYQRGDRDFMFLSTEAPSIFGCDWVDRGDGACGKYALSRASAYIFECLAIDLADYNNRRL